MNQGLFDEMLAALRKIADWDWDWSGKSGGDEQARGLAQEVVKKVERGNNVD